MGMAVDRFCDDHWNYNEELVLFISCWAFIGTIIFIIFYNV